MTTIRRYANRRLYRCDRRSYLVMLVWDARRWPDPIPVYPEEPNR